MCMHILLTISFSSQTSSFEHSHLRAYVGKQFYCWECQQNVCDRERAGFGNSARRGGIFQCSWWNTWGCGSEGFRKTYTKKVVGGCGWVPTTAYARSSGDRRKALGSTLIFSYCKYLTGPPRMQATREANHTW